MDHRNKPILWALDTIFPTAEATMSRWVFWRVQGPFTHSIEFGLFCTSMLALTHLALGHDRSAASRWLLSGSVAGTAFLSISSAPLLRTPFMRGLCSSWGAVHGCWKLAGLKRRGPPKTIHLQKVDYCRRGRQGSSPGLVNCIGRGPGKHEQVTRVSTGRAFRTPGTKS
jgi:hypothetical protein